MAMPLYVKFHLTAVFSLFFHIQKALTFFKPSVQYHTYILKKHTVSTVLFCIFKYSFLAPFLLDWVIMHDPPHHPCVIPNNESTSVGASYCEALLSPLTITFTVHICPFFFLPNSHKAQSIILPRLPISMIYYGRWELRDAFVPNAKRVHFKLGGHSVLIYQDVNQQS